MSKKTQIEALRNPDEHTIAALKALDAIQTDDEFETWMANLRMLWEAKKVALQSLSGARVRTDN